MKCFDNKMIRKHKKGTSMTRVKTNPEKRQNDYDMNILISGQRQPP